MWFCCFATGRPPLSHPNRCLGEVRQDRPHEPWELDESPAPLGSPSSPAVQAPGLSHAAHLPSRTPHGPPALRSLRAEANRHARALGVHKTGPAAGEDPHLLLPCGPPPVQPAAASAANSVSSLSLSFSVSSPCPRPRCPVLMLITFPYLSWSPCDI